MWLWAFLGHLLLLFGNEMLQMPRRLLRTPLKGMPVDIYMNGRKFSMPLSYIFPQNTVPSKLKKNLFWAGKNWSEKWLCFLHFEENTALDIRFWECRISSNFVFRHFLCKLIFSRGKGLDKEVIFLSFFLHLPTTITMTKTQDRDFALIFQI